MGGEHDLKEHLQFLAMLIPTLLLLSAAAVSLAFPSPSMVEPAVMVIPAQNDGE